MKKLLFICSIFATFSLQAWSCFGKAAPKDAEQVAQNPNLAHHIVPKAAFQNASAELTSAFTAVDGPGEAGVGTYFVAYSNDGRFAAATNFGDNTVSVFRVDCNNGTLELIQTVEAGSFPIQLDYSPCDNYAAVVNSDSPDTSTAGPNGSVTVYRVDCETGEWSLIQTIADPNLPYSVAYSPDGRFAAVVDYTDSANGVNSRTSIYRVSQISGKFAFVDSITNDRGQIVVDWSPNGKFIAVTNFDVDSVSVYSVDQFTGELTELSTSPYTTGNAPHAVAYQHDGNFAAVTNSSSSDPSVSVFEVNPVTGEFILPPQEIDTTSANTEPAYIAFSKDDTLAAVGSFNNPGSVVVFCVTDGTWCTTPVQTLPPAEFPQSAAFAPCENNAVVSIFGDGEDPGTLQVFKVNDEVCPDCTL